MSEGNPLVPPGPQTELVDEAGGAAIASARAPFLYYDVATVAGINGGGVAHITLEAIRHLPTRRGSPPLKDFVVVAHMRMDLNALASLKQAIEHIETLIRPAQGAARN